MAEEKQKAKFLWLYILYKTNTIKQLPEEKLAEVVDFVTFLKEKYQPCTEKNIVRLGGIWEGFEPTDEEIQKARKEIWQHLESNFIPLAF